MEQMRHQIRWQSERGPRNFLVDMSCTSPVSGAGSSDNKSAQRADSQSCHPAELHPAALVKLPLMLHQDSHQQPYLASQLSIRQTKETLSQLRGKTASDCLILVRCALVSGQEGATW